MIRGFVFCLFAIAAGTSLGATPMLTISTQGAPTGSRALEEISKEAFRRIGYDVKIVVQPAERSLQAANNGEFDGEGLRVPGLSEQYKNLVAVPERYLGTSFVAFARKGAGISVQQGWSSVKPYRVAFITGWKIFEANAGDARVVTKVNSPEQLFLMLDSGRTDLALYTRTDGRAYLKSLGIGAVEALEPSLHDVDMLLYLNKKHEPLVPRIAQALRTMKSDGTHRRILDGIARD